MNYRIEELKIKNIVINALREDIGTKDATTEAVIPKNKLVRAALIAKEDGVVCGLQVAAYVFKLKDKEIKFKPNVKEGARIKRGKVMAWVSGRAQGILTAERVALNFISLLCGIATKTRKYVELVRSYKVKIMDTRKTIPGLRLLEKYAVRMGGGYNHRMKLDEMVLVKDNHLKVMGGYKRLKESARFNRAYQVELEVKNLTEFKQALRLNPDIIMLDNMSIKDIRKAVRIRNNSSLHPHPLTPKLEASGGVNLANIKQVAACGVDMISLGDLTHSVKSIDISLEVL
jgi:nicotinate-nucleotide pyrophosphorylase (carboxylating)